MKAKDIVIVVAIFLFFALLNSTTDKVYIQSKFHLYDIPDPVQVDISKKDRQAVKIGPAAYMVTKRASYDISAKVVGKRAYDPLEKGAAPYDIALIWGKMPHKSIDKHMSYSQFGRFGYYKYTASLPVDPNYIVTHFSNNHIVPANNAILRKIQKIKTGDYVQLKGYLIDLVGGMGDKSFSQNTSLTRNDTGNGACEIILVEEVNFLKK